MVNTIGEGAGKGWAATKTVAKKARTVGKKVTKEVEVPLRFVSMFGSIARSAGEVADMVKKLPKDVKIGLAATKFPGIIGGFLAIQAAAEDLHAIYVNRRHPVEMIQASCRVLLDLTTTTGSVASTLKFLNLVKVVGKQTIKWIPIFNIISYATGYLSLGLACYSLYESGKLLHAFRKVSKEFSSLPPTATDQEKAAVLQKAVAVIENRGIKVLKREIEKEIAKSSEKTQGDVIAQKRERLKRLSAGTISAEERQRVRAKGAGAIGSDLGLAPKAGTDLLARINRVSQLVISTTEQEQAAGVEQKPPEDVTTAIAEMGDTLKILKGRVGLVVGLKSLDVVNKIVEQVGLTFALFTPVPQAGYVILLATSVCSLVSFGGKFFFINANPFDPNSKSRAMFLLDGLHRGLRELSGSIRQAIRQ